MVSQRQKNAGQHQLKNGTVQHSFRFLACGSRLHFSSIPPGHHWESGLHTPADYFSGEAMDSFCFPKKTKNPNPSPIGKSSDFVVVVHLQGLEPWAHWLRETNVQQSSIFKIASIRYFYRFIVNLCFASAAFFAPVIPSCIRYPAVPVCKKCAKMCRAKISFLKQVSDFYAKPENGRVRVQNDNYDITCSDQASNVHQQLRFMAGIWTIE